MEDEEIAHVEIRRMDGYYRVDIQSSLGGVRFYENRRIDKVLKELAFDLNEELESSEDHAYRAETNKRVIEDDDVEESGEF